MDLKYALGLELDDPGFDASVLSEFLTRLVEHGMEEKVLDLLLTGLKDGGLVKAGGRQRTDSPRVLAAVRDLNRLELAGETLRATPEALPCAALDWLVGAVPVREWAGRYGPRTHSWHPRASTSKREEMALVYGRDGFTLLGCVSGWSRPPRPSGPPAQGRDAPSRQVLRLPGRRRTLVASNASCSRKGCLSSRKPSKHSDLAIAPRLSRWMRSTAQALSCINVRTTPQPHDTPGRLTG
ncbi:hypothetical protein ACH4SP_07625 [Streptomyces sp. NPDC021093]|uniref:hypothetical protein n=1 Tax=Streptomyces sp. NPDC021093 TaxID=3365112 RepID=UPI0037911117